MSEAPLSDSHEIRNGLQACIGVDGAELTSLRDEAGRELLWDAGPLWPSHSPVLFPIVGQLAGDQLHVDGRTTAMTRHGFARRRTFDWISREPAAAWRCGTTRTRAPSFRSPSDSCLPTGSSPAP